jgi:hypothetical protein
MLLLRLCGRRVLLAAADANGFLQAAPAQGSVLEKSILEGNGDAFALFLAPRASLLVVPRMQCDVH